MPPLFSQELPALPKSSYSSPALRDVGFVPRPFFPRLSRSVIADFEAEDAAAFCDEDRIDLSSSEWIEFLAASFGERAPDDARLGGARGALEQSFIANWSHSISALKRGNAMLVGSPEASSEWRSSAVWIGRVSQSESAWLGSPPKKLQMLMQQWQALNQLPLPASLRMSIATARLLQIHPFSDGNGRTARWFGLVFILSYLNGSRKAAGQLVKFWSQPSVHRHAASYATCSDDDWTPWLDQWKGAD